MQRLQVPGVIGPVMSSMSLNLVLAKYSKGGARLSPEVWTRCVLDGKTVLVRFSDTCELLCCECAADAYLDFVCIEHLRELMSNCSKLRRGHKTW